MKTRLNQRTVMLTFAFIVTLANASISQSTWWDSSWPYRKPVTIDNSNGSVELTEYQINLVLNSAALISEGKMLASGNDIRFTDADGNLLGYWIESGLNTAQTKIWVNVSFIPASDMMTIYMYYGNPNAFPASDGNNTFVFFEEFPGTELNTGKWDWIAEEPQTGGYFGRVLVENSNVQLWSHGQQFNYGGAFLKTQYAVMNPPLVMETFNNVYLNTGSDVNSQIHLSDVLGHTSQWGAWLICYAGTTLRGRIWNAGSYFDVFTMTRPAQPFDVRLIVNENGVVDYYIDGILKGSSSSISRTIPTSISYSPAFWMSWNTNYKCDRVIFRKYAEVVPSVTMGSEGGPDPVLTAHWNMDEGAGNSVTDITGNGNNGLLHGAQFAGGLFGDALYFDGVNDYVQVEHSDDLTPQDAITLMFWAKPDKRQYGNMVVKFDSYQKRNRGYMICYMGLPPWTYGQTRYVVDNVPDNYFIDSPDAMPFNEWSHVAVTYDGSTVIGYRDGVEKCRHAMTGPINHNAYPLIMGARYDVYPNLIQYFGGYIDEVRLFNGALSASQIAAFAVRPPSNEPPVAIAQNVVKNADPTTGVAIVTAAEVNNNSYDPDGDPITLDLDPEGPFSRGVTPVSLTVSDGQESVTADATVTVNDLTPPALTVPENITRDTNPGESFATVEFAAAAVDNCDGEILVECEPPSGSQFSVGTTTVTCTATDESGNEASESFDITVVDNEAPVITTNSDILEMWPPNHKYKTILVEDLVESVSDNCECEELLMGAVLISKVTSDEEENGPDDGDTENDILIEEDFRSVRLRCERNGEANGRVYTIHLCLTDCNGNEGLTPITVGVPLDKESGPAVDDGPAYEVLGSGEAIPEGLPKTNPLVSQIALPTEFNLFQNYPNPFNPSTTIQFTLPEAQHIRLEIYNVQGEKVTSLFTGHKEAGHHRITWNATNDMNQDVSGGIYLCRFQAQTFSKTIRMLLLE